MLPIEAIKGVCNSWHFDARNSDLVRIAERAFFWPSEAGKG
ncbi:MAG: hypothetical protein OSA23_13470 [Rhodospirillales bacterium]|nr:hypothetical protein [Rhodospirillales bacterium]